MPPAISPLFAFSISDAVLSVFGDAAEALAWATVAGGDFLFFSADGSGLQRSTLPDGSHYLRPWASCSSCSLPQVLPLVQEVRGDAMLDSLPAIEAWLERQRRLS